MIIHKEDFKPVTAKMAAKLMLSLMITGQKHHLDSIHSIFTYTGDNDEVDKTKQKIRVQYQKLELRVLKTLAFTHKEQSLYDEED